MAKVFRVITRVVSDAGKGVTNVLDEGFEELIEKPGKKIIQETKETITGTDKNDYRQPVQPEVTPEVTPEIVPDEEPMLMKRGRRRTKRSGQGGTILEGYGALQRPKGEKAVVQEISMSFLRPKVNIPPPPPPPEPPQQADSADTQRAAAMAEENARQQQLRRKGRGSTIVAGGLTANKQSDNKTLLG